jgi:hypothetical protein|tara:strand:- start:2637 stop:2747 length:111 start_codon:yes stop_codon:yes gene_type:complete
MDDTKRPNRLLQKKEDKIKPFLVGFIFESVVQVKEL